MKVLIVDDHAVVRRGLRQILADEFPDAVIGEADTGAETLAAAWQERWDLVLLDIDLPGRSGLDVLRELKGGRQPPRVLMLTLHAEEVYAIRAFKAGADGYLTKRAASEELVAAVRKIMAGGRYVTASLAERLAAVVQRSSGGALHESLSDREYDVLLRLAAGKTVKEIAGELSLSVKTVSTYRTRLLDKMQLATNAELARYALAHGLTR